MNGRKETSISFIAHKFINTTYLSVPSFDKEFILFTDASNFEASAVFSQEHDGKEVVIAYASKHFNDVVKRYATIENSDRSCVRNKKFKTL